MAAAPTTTTSKLRCAAAHPFPPFRRRRQATLAAAAGAPSSPPPPGGAGDSADAVVVGAGIGGLAAGALLAWHGRKVVVCESHYRPGGCAHGFQVDTDVGAVKYDTGPSFFSGLTEPRGLNPLAAILKVLDEPLETVKYDPLGAFHVDKQCPPLQRFSSFEKLVPQVERFSPQGARELRAALPTLQGIRNAMVQLPSHLLRADWQAVRILFPSYLRELGEVGKYASLLGISTAQLCEKLQIRDPWLRSYFDLESFLLAGVDSHSMIAAEFASVFGESDALGYAEFPVGSVEEVANALVRGLEKHGGELKLKTHVERILVDGSQVKGVKLRGGSMIRAPVVISNATLWDTVHRLLPEDTVSQCQLSRKAEAIRPTDSFMHLHATLRVDDLDLAQFPGHHVVLNNALGSRPVDEPGNCCMLSFASVWDKEACPAGMLSLHAYTMEPFAPWQAMTKKGEQYEQKKRERARPLYEAVAHVLGLSPEELRERIVHEMTASPLSHNFWLRRHRGTYGPAINHSAGETFPGPQDLGIRGLYRVGDTTVPGIGVPAVAGSAFISTNTIVTVAEHKRLLSALEC